MTRSVVDRDQAPERGSVRGRSVAGRVRRTTAPQNSTRDAQAAEDVLTSPVALTPARSESLQRRAGNRAMAGLVARQQRPERSRRAGSVAVQRFPATALSAPVDWKLLTGSVVRPGEGVSGGVYILTSNQPNGAVKKVVVKPVFGANGLGMKETGEQLQFGDRALAGLLGINTPTSRVVQLGTREFSSLLSVIRPHQPKPWVVTDDDPLGTPEWTDISSANSFIVMGEVPQARSISSMAEKAATRGAPAVELLRALFYSPTLLQQLARMAVGDLLLGNKDRMVLGGMNLGNIMVSSDGTVHAIDTAAALPKAVDPKDVVSSGTSSGGGFSKAKGDVDDPADRLHGFFRAVINRIREATKKPPDGDTRKPTWELFQEAYDKKKDWAEKTFVDAFKAALDEIAQLIETKTGRAKLTSLTGDYTGTKGEGDLSHAALKANAMYLAGRANGKDHQEAAADAAAYAAYRRLMALDPANLTIPAGDSFGANAMVTHAPSSVRGAEVESLAPLMPETIGNVRTQVRRRGMTGAFDDRLLAVIGQRVTSVKNAVQADLGTKTRRGREKTRNRVLAADYLADSYMLAGGALRAVASVNRFAQVPTIAAYLAGGSLRPQQAVNVLGAIRSFEAQGPTLRQAVSPYATNLRAVATDVAKFKKFAGSAELAQALRGVADDVDASLNGDSARSLANAETELKRVVPAFLTAAGTKQSKSA